MLPSRTRAFEVAQSCAEDLLRCQGLLKELRAWPPARGGDAPQGGGVPKAKAGGGGDDARIQALEWQVAELAAALAAECSARDDLAREHEELKSMLTKTYGQVVDDLLSATQMLRAKDKHICMLTAAASAEAPSAERDARGSSPQPRLLAAGSAKGGAPAPPTQPPVQLRSPAHAPHPPRADTTAHSDTGTQRRQDQQHGALPGGAREPAAQRTAGAMVGAVAAGGGGGALTAGGGSAAAVLGGIERFLDGGWTTRTHGMRAAPAAPAAPAASAQLPSAAGDDDSSAAATAAAAAPDPAGATAGAQLPGSGSDDGGDGIGGDGGGGGGPFVWERLASVLGSSSSESEDLPPRTGGHYDYAADAQREQWEQQQQQQREQQQWGRAGGSLLERMGLASHMSDAAHARPSLVSSLYPGGASTHAGQQHGVLGSPSSATAAADGHQDVRVERGREYMRTPSMPAAFGVAPPGVSEWSTVHAPGAAQVGGVTGAGAGAGGAPVPPAPRAWQPQHPQQQDPQQQQAAGAGPLEAGRGALGARGASVAGGVHAHHDNPTASTVPPSGWRLSGGGHEHHLHEPTTASDQLFAAIKGQLASLQEEWGVGPPAGLRAVPAGAASAAAPHAHPPPGSPPPPPSPPQQAPWRHAAATAAGGTTVPAARPVTPTNAAGATRPPGAAGLLDDGATSDLIWPAATARPRGFVVVGAGGVL